MHINRRLQALANFNEYREIHIRTPRSNSSDFMKIQISFAEENDFKKILFEISFEDLGDQVSVVGKARLEHRKLIILCDSHIYLRCEGSLCCDNCKNPAIPILDSCRKNPGDIFNLNLHCTHQGRPITRIGYEDLLKDNLGK